MAGKLDASARDKASQQAGTSRLTAANNLRRAPIVTCLYFSVNTSTFRHIKTFSACEGQSWLVRMMKP